MEYNVVNKAQENSELLSKLLEKILTQYSRQLYGFTKAEFDMIAEYDVLNIMAFYYGKMNADQKNEICYAIKENMHLSFIDDILDNLSMFADDMYIPLSCKLIDRLGDTRITMIVYESLFSYCKRMTVDIWNQNDSYSNYLILLNSAYFTALSYKLHAKNSCKSCMNVFYGMDSYDDLVEFLYEKHLDDLGWDEDVELDVLEELINDSKHDSSFEAGSMEEYSDAVSCMEDIRTEHFKVEIQEDDKRGFELIVQKTGIREHKSMDIHGFECHFCEAKVSNDEYIIVYQKDTRITDIIDKEEEWRKFQHDLYYADIKEGKSTGMVYIIYILDDNSDNIPIQVIESNKTYGRKYVFSEEETITYINGIVNTSNDEIAGVSPVQEWDKILREEHLTGCLTEAYASKKVESYLLGKRFDADYIQDDDYALMRHSKVPPIKWVKSIDTTGFREFCFDGKNMEFGQINLFHGANGSGKTSVLEAIEYALTAEVRRVKDFKVKMPSASYPRLSVYDRQAGVHHFTPDFSKKNNKEIERVWYGVPIGRTKSNLNENFNRFNSFDSEAAYKFIHESDNSEESFASMFGNLMFGETVVNHEKKWTRFKKAFDERYSELREELSSARSMVEFYEEILSNKSEESKSEDIEKSMIALKLISKIRLPKAPSDRYPKLMEELTLIRKYVDILSVNDFDEDTFGEIKFQIIGTKRKSQQYIKEKKEKSNEITKLTEQNGELKQKKFDEQENQSQIQERINSINVDIRNWSIVQNVLSHEDTIKLVNDLLSELTILDRELYYISKLEQHNAIVNFLKLDSYERIQVNKRQAKEEELADLKNKKNQLENQYNEVKKSFGEKEQQSIELRKIGKTLLVDEKCPLCGHAYDSTQQLIDIIDNAVVVDDSIEKLISETQVVSKQIIELERILDREKLIDKALRELSEISASIPMVEICGTDYKALYEYLNSKTDKEKRKEEIIEQQAVLDRQGYSLKNITACREYKTTDATYLRFEREGTGTYTEYLTARLEEEQRKLALSENLIAQYDRQVRQNQQREELLRNEIRRIDSMLDAMDIDSNREAEQALENLKSKFKLDDKIKFKVWENSYHELFDKCEMEVERMQSQDSIAYEKQSLAEYKAIVKRVEPMVARCARAVQAFERMPSLSSFVENGITKNIEQISTFFTMMHHSREFERLGIDSEGIYAVRGRNSEIVRTYQMSTGQRATIAMSVMFSLHIAAPDAPQFLLLDEPLATMDDTQVNNVLGILKQMAEQGTQIFFTTSNGIMINLFKECFKNTDFDYKEYQFVKRVNMPSEIKETSINDTKSIEELTLENLTLDYNQFAQIREILRKNQEKLVAKDEWEVFDDDGESKDEKGTTGNITSNSLKDNFFTLLSEDERKLLMILVNDDGSSARGLSEALASYPTFRIMFEVINEKAVDFFGETIVENDDELPWMGNDYIEEVKEQYEKFTSNKE